MQIHPPGEIVWGQRMNCILNHCHEQIATDVVVIVFYATAVSVMIVLAWLSQSKTVQATALMFAGFWLLTMTYFFYIDGMQYYALTLLVDCALAYQFWRMARTEIFPVVLCGLMVGQVLFLVGALSFSLNGYWIIFVLNRIFELTLAYIIGCSIYRIRKFETPAETRDHSADMGLKFIAG